MVKYIRSAAAPILIDFVRKAELAVLTALLPMFTTEVATIAVTLKKRVVENVLEFYENYPVDAVRSLTLQYYQLAFTPTASLPTEKEKFIAACKQLLKTLDVRPPRPQVTVTGVDGLASQDCQEPSASQQEYMQENLSQDAIN